MKSLLSRLWTETSGVLSFEWITLNSVVALGVVGGLSSVRDALNDEMADMTEAITSLDQSYLIQPPRCVAVLGREDGAGGPSPVVQTGMGYSTQEWNELVKSHPELAGQYRHTWSRQSSGATGSRFLDRKPKMDGTDPARVPQFEGDNPGKLFNDPTKIIDPPNVQ